MEKIKAIKTEWKEKNFNGNIVGRGWRRGTARTGSNNTCGGYNKRGAVTREALENCGYKFRCVNEDGTEDYTSEERAEKLLKAIAEAEGIKNYLIIEMHY